MSFLDKIFGTNESEKTESKVNWIPLNDFKDLENVTNESFKKTVVLFKHSTRCSISRFALKQFENEFDLPEESISLYFLDLLNFRAISNKIADDFQVMHQSPQMIVLKDGVVVFSSTHSDINANDLKRFL